ncbi:ABC transporter permease [Cohnella thailandensis]|uniref:ABC transporter permease n=1 Tax=Cohnella thailandensis TaxID=557557 RepID=A0A841T333_9BACL|nr:ABC transporter permease [Cohnella thailandensis]MBB6636778.1 ABC transporter permease [Cohnella thailandensis]MBP1973345.1 ABC-2 type transport system permease protein [Cohnella thailandensis]
MANLLSLVQNETLKVWKKKRFAVIVLVLLVLIPIFVYAQLKISQNNAAKFADWRSVVQQRITDNMNAIASDRIPEEWKKWRRSLVQQLQYYLDRDVNPDTPNAVTFTATFLENSVTMFIPLMVLAIASDLVSSERASGTIKMLLTRPVRRWKILTSKLIALTLYVSLIIPTAALLSYLIAGLAFGYEGWGAPVFVGFRVNGTAIETSSVHAITQGAYLLMEMGLVWFSAMTVAAISFMVSVLLQSAAASLVTMMAAVISGAILANMASSWSSAKYLFNVNLNLTSYLQGTPPPIEGMSLGFSLVVLAVWGAVSLTTAFAVFTKRDVLN